MSAPQPATPAPPPAAPPPAPLAAMDGREWAVTLAAIAGLVLFCYGRVIAAPFQYDDEVVITLNPRLHDPLALGTIFAYNPFRWAVNWTFALQWVAAGETTWAYRSVNLGLHAVNGLLVLLLVRQLLRAPWAARFPRAGGLRWAPHLAALLFIAHPLQTQAVTYIVQRYAVAACLCYLGGLLLYTRFRETGSRAALGGALGAFFLGLGCKETILTLPLAVLLVEGLFHDGLAGVKRVGRWLLLAVPIGLLAVWLKIGLGSGSLADVSARAGRLLGIGETGLPFSGADYLRTQSWVLLKYIRLLALPYGQSIEHDVPILRSMDGLAVASFAGVLAVIGLAVGLLLASRAPAAPAPDAPDPDARPPAPAPDAEPATAAPPPPRPGDARLRARLAGFGLLWFFLTLSIESSIFPVLDPCVEHRLYLAMPGFCLLVLASASALEALLARARGRPAPRMLAPVAVAVLIAFHAALTVERNAVWSSVRALWLDALRHVPDRAKPWHNLGTALEREDRLDLAERCYDRAIALYPGYGTAWANRGWVACRRGVRARETGDLAAARRHFLAAEADCRRALELVPGFAQGWNFLGLVLDGLERPEEAARAFEEASRLQPEWVQPVVNIGALRLRHGDPRGAIPLLREVHARLPRWVRPRLELALALHRIGGRDEALALLRGTRFREDADFDRRTLDALIAELAEDPRAADVLAVLREARARPRAP